MGNLAQIFCPCIDCRNVCHQPNGTVLEHLVIKGTDQKYKRNKCWSKHGDIRPEKTVDIQTSEYDAYNLIRSAFSATECKESSQGPMGDQSEGDDTGEESKFRKVRGC